MNQGTRLLAGGVILMVAAAATYGILRQTYGQRPAYVHVRWAPTVDDASRVGLERTHSLTQGELREGRTWGYILTDVSRQNIQALVANPAAEDTHNLHRTAFRVWRTAPRTAYLSSRPTWLATLLEFLIRAFAGLGGLAVLMGGYRLWRARAAPTTGRA